MRTWVRRCRALPQHSSVKAEEENEDVSKVKDSVKEIKSTCVRFIQDATLRETAPANATLGKLRQLQHHLRKIN